MHRTATLFTVLTIASTYVVSSAGASDIKTGGRAQESRPRMELSETAWKNDLVVAPPGADLIDVLDSELNESLLLFPTGSPTESPTGSPTGSPTASPTLYFFPTTVHDKREEGYTAPPSPSLLPAFNVDIPGGGQETPTALPNLAPSSTTATFPAVSTLTVSPNLAPSSPTTAFPTALTTTASPTLTPSSPTASFPTVSTPTASPTLTLSSPAASTPTDSTNVVPSSPTAIPEQATSRRHLRGGNNMKIYDYVRDDHQSSTGSPKASPKGSTTAPTSAPDTGEEANRARVATMVAMIGIKISAFLTTLAISMMVVATTSGAEAFSYV
ncbi:unnamed protein product [Ascophyllum nodosum]